MSPFYPLLHRCSDFFVEKLMLMIFKTGKKNGRKSGITVDWMQNLPRIDILIGILIDILGISIDILKQVQIKVQTITASNNFFST